MGAPHTIDTRIWRRARIGVEAAQVVRAAMPRILIGTSGWHYGSWRGPFFPDGLPVKAQLQYYASQFATAELNGVFYRTPTPEAVRGWAAATGRDFIFSWKASKFITHWKRLSDKCDSSLDLLEQRISLLGAKAGPILFQLPPQFAMDAGRLSAFTELLSERRRYAFEFRHPSWYQPEIFRILKGRNIALCLSDHHDAPSPWRRTADFVYIRGHGPGGRYEGRYGAGVLTEWATRIRSWKKQGCDVYVYFDNDIKSAAPADALQLRGLLASAVGREKHRQTA
jgi:uncharacterized protein YecE (DUF72 family)